MTDALTLLERKPEVRASTPSQYVRQRLVSSTDNLNRAGQLAAQVELVNEALCRLTQLVYTPDTDGDFANICPVTWRLLVPAPWGSAGWKKWGLRYWERNVLRYILRQRQDNHKPGQRPPLYLYDSFVWYVNVADYPSGEAATFWLRGSSITLKEWRQGSSQYRDTVATVQRQYRDTVATIDQTADRTA